MLPKRKRIPRSLFPSFRGGTTYHTDHFIITYYSNRSTIARYAAVVSKKVLPTAVQRHHIRRRIYTVIADCEKRFSISAGLYIVTGKKNVGGISFATIEKELEQAFQSFL